MNNFKCCILIISAAFFLASCGTTGRIRLYNFNQSKHTVERDILNIINENAGHRVPVKWNDIYKGDYFERIYIYFMKGPEELYQIGFTGDSKEWNVSQTCRLGLIAQFDGKRWGYESDLSRKEIDRITKRFEQEILSKIIYGYSITD